MDADGGNQRNLTQDTAEDYGPDWSPDGKWIAFSNDAGDIWVMNRDGSGKINLTPSVGNYNWDPSWSPDGSKIAFWSTRQGWGDIFVMDVDGSNVTNLTTSGPRDDSDPSWSPDGSEIAFTSCDRPPNSSSSCIRDLYVMDSDGSNFRRLTWSPTSIRSPAWSPDGRHISFFSDADGDGDLWMVDPDGSNLGHLTDDPGEEWGGAWESVRPPSTVGLVDPGTGLWRLRNDAGAESSFYYGNPGDYPFMGDWDCNGTDTPGLYRQSDGFAYLRNSNTQGVADVRFFFGNPSDIPLAGDFDGDGCDTLSIYRPSEARLYIINRLGSNDGGLGAAEYSFLFGNPGDKPVAGDWDGDGIDEIGLHRETTGFFYYRNTLTTGIADGQFYFGNPGDRFVAGDWGIIDRTETPGLFRPSDSTFYLRHTLTQGNADSQFTWPGAGRSWLPVSGVFTLD
jgi:dipeptidyl aminopeptidase/acylaminoacyl peptidase